MAFERRGGTREAGSNATESLVAGWVRTRFSEGGGQLNRRRARRVLKHRAQESKARTGWFLREQLISDNGLSLPSRVNRERRTGKIRGLFSGMHRALDGWMLAHAPASRAEGLHHHGPWYFNFP